MPALKQRIMEAFCFFGRSYSAGWKHSSSALKYLFRRRVDIVKSNDVVPEPRHSLWIRHVTTVSSRGKPERFSWLGSAPDSGAVIGVPPITIAIAKTNFRIETASSSAVLPPPLHSGATGWAPSPAREERDGARCPGPPHACEYLENETAR